MMNNCQTPTPTVSVVIASYNQERYIEQAVRSVLAQDYPHIEIIVVDDCSSARSPTILTQLQQEVPQVITIREHPQHQNRGIAETYQLGIRHSRGPYIAFLEGDDWWPHNYLTEKVAILNCNTQVGVVFSPYKTVTTRHYGLDMALRQWYLLRSIPHQQPFSNFRHLVSSCCG